MAGLVHRLFWRPVDDRIYAVVRVAFAFAAFVNLVTLWPERTAFFSDAGMIDHDVVRDWSGWLPLSYFELATSPGGVSLVLLFSGIWMVLLGLGVLPRTSALMVFLWHLSLASRAPLVSTGWDFVLRAFGFLILISPLGRSWSLPAFLGKLEPARESASYGLTLMRMQVFVIYAQTVILKLGSEFWRNGEFMGYYLLSHMARWPSASVLESEGLLKLVTWLTLAVELAIPILLWIRRTRWFGFALGFVLHAAISIASINLGLFFLTMTMTYLCFLRREDIDRFATMLGKRRPQA